MSQIAWSRAELAQAGKTQRHISRALREGVITRVFHGVYITEAPSAETVWAALEKYAPGQALLDGESALAVHEGKTLELPLRIRVPANGIRRVRSAFVQAKASRRMGCKKIKGFRVVNLVDAIATCLEVQSVKEKDLRFFVEKHFPGEFGMKQIAAGLRALGKRPKQAVRAFLDHCIAGTDSNLEWKFVNALRKKGFSTQQNALVGGYKWDVCLKELRVVIDLDSSKYHGSARSQTFIIDRWKTNHAQLLGWTALRITDECLAYNLFHIVSMLEDIRRFRKTNPSARLKAIAQNPVWTWHVTLHD